MERTIDRMRNAKIRGGAVLAGAIMTLTLAPQAKAAMVRGTVTDEKGNALTGARVRWQGRGEEAVVTSDSEGRFALFMNGSPDYQSYYFVALAKKGYYNAGGGVQDGRSYEIPMTRISDLDNDGYVWVPPQPTSALSPITGGMGCGACHGDYYDAWKTSKHAQAATDPFVLDLYTGGGAEGRAANMGPGYRIDNPDKAGPCANCHAATAALNAPDATFLDRISGVHLNGVYCESCHKVRDVGDITKTPVDGAFRYWRPETGVLMAFGPLDDANDEHHMGPMSYVPELGQSRFCAGCHEWENEHGLPVLQTFSEWAKSKYASLGIRCQDCHMRSLDHEEAVRPLPPSDYTEGDPMCILRSPSETRKPAGATCDVMGAVGRDQTRIHPHGFAGTDEVHLLGAATLQISAERTADVVDVEVKVENVNAGHMLPTGMPFRNVLLVVRAYDEDGSELTLKQGSLLPEWAGAAASGEPLSGTAGRGFARVLSDDSGESNVPFWRATTVLADTRVPPMSADVSSYRFAVRNGGTARIDAMLIYRRFYSALAEAKGWTLIDEPMAMRSTDVPAADSCQAVSPNPILLLVVLTLAWAASMRNRRHRVFARGGASVRSTILQIGVMSASLFFIICAVACNSDGPGKLSNAALRVASVETLPNGAQCPADESCTSGRCVAQCDGVYACAAASCLSDSDCALPQTDGQTGRRANLCCVDGACGVAPGGACGSRDETVDASCATGGDSDCAVGLRCAGVCTPAAVCVRPCQSVGDCEAPLDPQTGRSSQLCVPLDGSSGFCLDDPEIAEHCDVTADCRVDAASASAICDWSLARSGDAIVTMCRAEPWGPTASGHSCAVGTAAPDPALCEAGWCWTGNGFNNVCSNVCRPELGDSDCTCPADDAECHTQICLPFVFHLSDTDHNKRATVSLCFDGTRCRNDADCPTDRYCASNDLWVDIQTVCLPKRGDGLADGAACGGASGGGHDHGATTETESCASGRCVNSVCAPLGELGAACANDDECLDRCLNGLCSGPCTDDAYCSSFGADAHCSEVALPYGPPVAHATKAVKMCVP